MVVVHRIQRSFLVAEARAGLQLPGTKERPSRIQVSQSWWVDVHRELGCCCGYEAWNTGYLHWEGCSKAQECEVAKGWCSLDAQLRQRSTRCHRTHAPWMDHGAVERKSKMQHLERGREGPYFWNIPSAPSTDGWQSLTLLTVKEKFLQSPIYYQSR